MGMFKVNHQKQYTVISNAVFQNKVLSLKAKGLLGYMLSVPEDWDFSISGLVKCLKEGRDAITSTLNELIEHGYVVRSEMYHNEKGHICYDYTVYENPNQSHITGTPTPQNQEPHKKAEKPKKKTLAEETADLFERFTDNPELIEALNGYVDMRKMQPQKDRITTKRQIKLLLTELVKLSTNEFEQVDILNQSILNNWKSVYPLKNKQNGKSNGVFDSNQPPKGGWTAEDIRNMEW